MKQTAQHDNPQNNTENKTEEKRDVFKVLEDFNKEKEVIGKESPTNTSGNINPQDLNKLRKNNIANNLEKITEHAFAPRSVLFFVKKLNKEQTVVEKTYIIEIKELPVSIFHSFCGVVDDYSCPERFDIALEIGLDKKYHFILNDIGNTVKEEIVNKIKEINNIAGLLKDRDPYPQSPDKKDERSFSNDSILSIMRLASLLAEKYGGGGPLNILKTMTYKQILWYVDLLLYDNYDLYFSDVKKKTGAGNGGTGTGVGGPLQSKEELKTQLTGSFMEEKFFANLPPDAVLKEDTGGCLVYNRTYKVP